MEMELLRWSAWLNIFLFLMCVGGIITGVFWGISVGQRLGRGEPTNFFGGRVKGDAWQAPSPDPGSGEQNPGAYQAGGSSMKDPLAFLDDHINRSLRQRAEKPLLDPDLAGQSPVQAGRGGE